VSAALPLRTADLAVDEFVGLLSAFPAETSIIADSVYANSKTLDGNRFAEEYLRKCRSADKGIIEPFTPASAAAGRALGGAGWSEVAKKPAKEPAPSFKEVPARKRGRKG
jgi:PERQ amino acid-rich with GYF domain-containing protein